MWPEKFWEILKKRSLKIIQRLDLLEPIGGWVQLLKHIAVWSQLGVFRGLFAAWGKSRQFCTVMGSLTDISNSSLKK